MAIIALAGGGTGGHVYPALAIGDVLRARGHTVLYYGEPERLEGRVAPERGYAFRAVRAVPFPRSGLMGRIRFAWGLLQSSVATRAMLKEDKVDAVLGVGGYISAPPVLAAWWLGKKRAIHEANAVPGLANRLCGRVAQAILLTFERTRDQFPAWRPRELVGVPVNPKVLQGDRVEAAVRYGLDPARPVCLFVGGSLGAARLNELAVAAAKDPERKFQILHLCGPRYEGEVRAALGDSAPPDYTLRPYEDRIGFAYAMADLVVCRAGSSTLAELCAVGKAGLLIPSPNVTENHQEENARGLESVGGAEVLVEGGWDLAASLEKVRSLMADPSRLRAMGERSRTLAKLDAADRAADVIERLIDGR